jgi:hypothetical protein
MQRMKNRSIECGFSGAEAANTLIRDGPTIWVDIGFDPTWQPDQVAKRPDLGALRIRALIDTGADASYIDYGLAARLNLPIVNRLPARVLSSAGPYDAEVYLAQIFVRQLQFIQYGEFAGVHLSRYGEPYEVQIGRAFLSKFTLFYNGLSGQVTLRMP